MSSIASFWTLPATARSAIVEAFKPVTKRRWLFSRKTIYPWFDWMQKHAHEEADFNRGGSAMVDFELITTGTAGSVLALGLPESDSLSQSSGASVALLDNAAARLAISRLQSLTLSEEDVVRFYDADSRPEDWRCEPASIVAAHRQLVSWCRTVGPDRIGLLMVG